MPSSNSWLSRHRNGAFYTLALILVATLACGGVTAAVHWGMTDAFAEADAKLDESKGGAQRALLFPDATFEKVSAPAVEGLVSVYKTDSGDYVFDVASKGYHGDVEVMVGITSAGKVAGIQVVAEDETDGIGTNALTEDYFGTFTDLDASGVLTVEEPASGETKVDGVSGATFTAKAIVADLNIAFEAYAQMGGK
ncbi:FMN-binding protein [Collinsella tanakaei]|uniref:FMN-binding protein n=1 Tax=Collinsella tanakaei TaxID=626935 RepID=UPI00265CFFDD|nr:FMN-binding protein [Collinsella tanakaei]